ncbi:MAG: HEAT repeat domain-containing protein [Candidatus Poribacteria bacterium]|nr:HEAT repeat domain-containing protein [Candidatus Poribacteria bacterium]
MKKYTNLCIVAIGVAAFLMGCGTQNESLSKGKELIKSDKRRKEERAAQQFKLAIQQEADNAEAHYLLGYYDSETFYEDGDPQKEKASIEERGKHMFLAYQNDKRKYREILVFETLRDRSPEVQNTALDALKRIYKQDDRKKLLNSLKKAIKSNDNRDRHDAQWVLAALGREDADTIIPILLDLLDYKREETRLNAVKALGKIGSEKAVPNLVQIVNSGSAKRKRDREVAEIRRLAVEALGNIGGAAVQELVAIVQNKGSSMRVDAIQALEKLGDERAVNPLLEVLSDQGSREVVVQF